MPPSRYEQLQRLTKIYGEETWVYFKRVTELGPEIVKAYAAYLGGPKTAANAVPPIGEFDPRALYRGDAFDCHNQGTQYLAPICFGVCTEIGNLADRGATWVRTILEFHPAANGLRLCIGSRQRQIHVGANLADVELEICEAIYQDVREAFTLELDQAQGRARIGFSNEA